MLSTYDGMVRAQMELNACVNAYGGECDGWVKLRRFIGWLPPRRFRDLHALAGVPAQVATTYLRNVRNAYILSDLWRRR